MIASESVLEKDVQFVKGVGPRWFPYLTKLGIRTLGDLLHHYPRRYEDRSKLPSISELRSGEHATVRGTIRKIESKNLRGGRVLLRVMISDGDGFVWLSWFNQPWIKKKLDGYKQEVIAYGMIREKDMSFEIQSPELELIEDEADVNEFARIVPVYPLTEGLAQVTMRRIVANAVGSAVDSLTDPLPADFRKRYELISYSKAIDQIHLPDSMTQQADARRRLVFEEFFYLQLEIQMRRNEIQRELGIAFPLDSEVDSASNLFGGESSGDLWEQIRKLIPFELTGAQTRVVEEVWRDMRAPTPMNRLIQGDVGSGKTAVAACAMLAAVRCGYQVAMMVPTEILAEQHYMGISKLFESVGLNVVLLTGKLSEAQRKRAQLKCANGEADIIIGTHALIQERVNFAKLGLCVIDEQHRFGVMERAALRQKSGTIPDIIFMSATPIPRTLTMTIYGDLDLSIIDELPPGRKEIKTHHKGAKDRSKVYESVDKLLESGRQAYFVTPLIDENEKIQAQAATDLHYRLQKEIFPHRRVGLLHGQMKSAEKEAVMNSFRTHELDVLVATVVIEVGVDVPNASVMVIEDANRFGLAQLHQLRGRVGRGEHQSFCILIGELTTDDSAERIRVMTETTDGFKISEADLQIRGPGEIAGTAQSGNLNFRIADLLRDSKLLEQARQAAIEYLKSDPDLSKPANQLILQNVKKHRTEVALITVS